MKIYVYKNGDYAERYARTAFMALVLMVKDMGITDDEEILRLYEILLAEGHLRIGASIITTTYTID